MDRCWGVWRLAVACFVVLACAGIVHAEPTVIKAAGSSQAEALLHKIVEACGRENQPARLDFRPCGNGVAAGVLVSGGDLIVTGGAVTAADLGSRKRRWDELAPQEQVLGGRAVAIVVHARNPVESLTSRQLASIFSRRVKDWSVVGGRRDAIRRYGLPPNDPAGQLFHERVQAASLCGRVLRKKDSAAVLDALQSDPRGIAFVDATAIRSASESVRVLAIGPAGGAVRPNAQTIKDGSYPLAESLVMYLSPQASATARDVAETIRAGRADGLVREAGFLPPLRAVRADVSAAFDKLYGSAVRKAKATDDPADDLALAEQLLASARSMNLDPPILTAMCEAAFDLARAGPGGAVIAFEALSTLESKVPAERFDCSLKRVALYEDAYQAENDPAAGEHLVDALMSAGEAGTAAAKYIEAEALWRRAHGLAETLQSPRTEAIQARMPAFEARAESARQAGQLADRLQDHSGDPQLRRQMLNLQVVCLDNPAAARPYLDSAEEESTRVNLPLALQPMDELSEESALKLAEWYAGLADRADVGGRELMRDRARRYYDRFFTLHADRTDALAMRASLGIQKVGGTVPPSGGKAKSAGRSIHKAIAPHQKITDLALAEYVAAHPDLTRLTRRELGSADRLTTLAPLARLRRLRKLDLLKAERITDLQPLGQMKTLRSLTLTHYPGEDLTPLSNAAGGLSALYLPDANRVDDIRPLARLAHLKSLSLDGCYCITDISSLASLSNLQRLYLTDCIGINDFKPLEKLAGSLTFLDLRQCGQFDEVRMLAKLSKLRHLDLRGCPIVTSGDLRWLKGKLPDCKILPTPPPDPKPKSEPGL